ncbi:D-alanine--D-alanine ligase [candidate division WOR-3 bacterium]|nr:D-alanine--D-alanine ligase [candidate division WOR-3 bacterium]
MSRDMTIAVVCGGSSREDKVSRVSGNGVAEALKETYRNVIVMELDNSLPRKLIEVKIDVAFPVLHGPLGEDGIFQGFLEILGIPYVGSGVLASAVAMNKVVAKSIFREFGLPTPLDVVVEESQIISVDEIVKKVGNDVVIKPAEEGSAFGVTFCRGEKEIYNGVRKVFEYGDIILIEKRIEGKEITVAVLERNGVEALPVIEIRTPEGSWYDYEHRYTPGLSEHIIPAPLPEDVYKEVQRLAIKAHRVLNCRDLSRADFVVTDDGKPFILEVNTIPGMTPTSLYPDAARAAGISFGELVAHFVERAMERSEVE